jgi:hypothetical protein
MVELLQKFSEKSSEKIVISLNLFVLTLLYKQKDIKERGKKGSKQVNVSNELKKFNLLVNKINYLSVVIIK